MLGQTLVENIANFLFFGGLTGVIIYGISAFLMFREEQRWASFRNSQGLSRADWIKLWNKVGQLHPTYQDKIKNYIMRQLDE